MVSRFQVVSVVEEHAVAFRIEGWIRTPSSRRLTSGKTFLFSQEPQENLSETNRGDIVSVFS